MRYQDPQLCDLLAAEYVLGTLHGRARARFEALLRSRPDLARQVEAWEARLARGLGMPPPQTPPAEAWERIERRLFPGSPEPGWLQRLWFWRSLALGSSLLAGVLAVVLLLGPTPSPERYVALVSDQGQEPTWIVSAAAAENSLRVKNVKRMDMPPNKRCLLWLQPKGSDRYMPLGVLPDSGEDMTLPIGPETREMLAGRLLVTVEDMDRGTPAAPSGPPQFEGHWVSL